MAKNDTPVGSLKVNYGGPSEEPKGKTSEQSSNRAVAKGNLAKPKKETLADKYRKTFVKTDLKTVGDELLTKKIVPGIISMIRDAIWDGITMHFDLGGFRGGTSSSKPGYTNYQAASSSSYSYKSSSQSNAQRPEKKKEGPTNYREIYYTSESSANEVKYSMLHYAREYDRGYASIADLYEFSDLTPNAITDNNWGWKADVLEGVEVKKGVIDGELRYILDLPNPVPVDN